MNCNNKKEPKIRKKIGCELNICCQDCIEHCGNPCDIFMKLIRELGDKVECEYQKK